jgi:hypothetical protein
MKMMVPVVVSLPLAGSASLRLRTMAFAQARTTRSDSASCYNVSSSLKIKRKALY